LTDAIDNGGTCTVQPATVDVAADADATADYACSFTSNPGSGTNTATATWTSFGSPNTSATASANYTFGEPTKVVNDTVHVTDTNGKAWDFSASGWESYDKTFTDPAGTCTSHQNTATIEGLGKSDSVTVTDCQGADLKVSKTAEPTFTRTYGWDITKSADKDTVYSLNGHESQPAHFKVDVTKDAGTDSDWAVSGKIKITNPSDWQDVTLNSLTDTVDNGGVCTVDPGPYTVPAGGSLSVDYSCAYASAPSSKDGTNTATVTWDADAYNTPDASASGDAGFAFETPTKLVNDSVHVTDTNGKSWDFTDSGSVGYDQTFTDPAGVCTSHTNTATIERLDKSAPATVKDCQVADPTVTKTAVPEFTRTFGWDIAKLVDQTRLEGIVGKQVTFNYTVNVTHDDGVDSGWLVSGKITVANGTAWEPITLTSITDEVDNGGVCTVDTSAGLTIPAEESLDYPYTCTYDAAPTATSGTNTASVTYDNSALGLPDGSASGTVDFAFDTPSNVEGGTIHVTDTLGGDLGTVSYTDPNPTTFAYAHSFAVPAAGTCKSYDNTATIKENGKFGQQTVEVCGWNATLTPGYWKNHLSSGSPNTKQFLPQYLGGYKVDSTAKATAVFNAMNCGVSTNQGAIGCLAGHLLAAELNVANKANPSINGTIADANAFLAGKNYAGPSATYTMTAAQRAYAVSLAATLDKYNNGKI
jgi:hypothetical protein